MAYLSACFIALAYFFNTSFLHLPEILMLAHSKSWFSWWLYKKRKL